MNKIIRKSTLNISEANKGKIESLELLMGESLRVMNLYIKELWEKQNFSGKYVAFKVDTWLSARMQQNLGKQAYETVKSQKKRNKQTMPVRKSLSVEFDSRFVDFEVDSNSFDFWIRLTSLGNGMRLKLPAHKHRQFNKFQDWDRLEGIKIRKVYDNWYADVYFEKDISEKVADGKVVGYDCGYKKLLVDSEGNTYDELKDVYKKIARKKQGSKAFKRALVERDNLINKTINNIDLDGVKEVVVEDLKNVKKGSKGKIRKKFNNKLQRWSYPKVLEKLNHICEEHRILFTKVNPAYTSQKCSVCGVIEKGNRKGERYQCACGNVIDADINAAINISHMGVYSPHVLNRFI